MILIFSMIQYDHFNADEMILENSQKKYPSCKTIPYFLLFRITKKKHIKPLATPSPTCMPTESHALSCSCKNAKRTCRSWHAKRASSPQPRLEIETTWKHAAARTVPRFGCFCTGFFSKQATERQENTSLKSVWFGNPNFHKSLVKMLVPAENSLTAICTPNWFWNFCAKEEAHVCIFCLSKWMMKARSQPEIF